MAFQYDAAQGKSIADDPRIYGLCEQRDFDTGIFSYKEDFEQSLVPGGRRLTIFYQIAQRWLNDFGKSLLPNGTLVDMDLYANSGNGMFTFACQIRLVSLVDLIVTACLHLGYHPTTTISYWTFSLYQG
jgi:hypothetical protein